MKVSQLIKKLEAMPPDAKVTLIVKVPRDNFEGYAASVVLTDTEVQIWSK